MDEFKQKKLLLDKVIAFRLTKMQELHFAIK